MMKRSNGARWVALGFGMTALAGAIAAQVAANPIERDTTRAAQAIRASVAQRLPSMDKVDEVRGTSMPGIFEVRIGDEIYYSDARGEHLLRGELVQTATGRNLTRERIEQLSAIEFASLPLGDAISWKTGTGQRRIAVFADPNCPYCRKLEADLQGQKDVTVYTFLYPILAKDSRSKSESVWCAASPTQTWRDWMLKGTALPKTEACETPLDRNLSFGKSHRIQGVPTIVVEGGSRLDGAVTAQDLERRLDQAARPAAR